MIELESLSYLSLVASNDLDTSLDVNLAHCTLDVSSCHKLAKYFNKHQQCCSKIKFQF
jgi:hypothetical protein